MQIQDYIDDILSCEEQIIKINNKISQIDDRNKKVDNLIDKINSLKGDISSTFIKAQNLIISSYFDKAFYSITNLEELENYRRKLYNFKDYLGYSEGYNYFNDYYVNRMMNLEDKYNLLENGITDSSLYLVKQKTSKILAFFRYIRKIIFRNKLEENKSIEK